MLMLLVLVVLALVVMVRYGAFGTRWWTILREAVRPAMLLGGIGFALGFFGPMIFVPGANQGPMLGIFITGPGGFVLGLIVGVFRARRVARSLPST
jgi:hypothetical protein